MGELQVLITVNAATLGSILFFGYKAVRFFSRIELKTDLMWEDYEFRIKGIDRRKKSHAN